MRPMKKMKEFESRGLVMAIYAETNAPYPNRIALYLAPYVGPFFQNGPSGTFNPIRDLSSVRRWSIHDDSTWSFDSVNNRYLLYLNQAFNLQGVVQIVHHVPDPPFGGLIG